MFAIFNMFFVWGVVASSWSILKKYCRVIEQKNVNRVQDTPTSEISHKMIFDGTSKSVEIHKSSDTKESMLNEVLHSQLISNLSALIIREHTI